MVNRFLRPLHRWPALQALIARIAGQFTTWPEDDFGRFASGTLGTGMGGAIAAMPPPVDPMLAPPPPSVAPEKFEMRFMTLHAQGRFDQMWEMLAEDAQRAWGGRETFARDMPRLDGETELLDMQVVSVAVLEGWTDREHDRSYSNVARIGMRYRVRQQWREWTFDRQVHLVAAAGGWRTLCYPTRTAVGR
jgi:hypothetical protein